jgi:hypothetical protein
LPEALKLLRASLSSSVVAHPEGRRPFSISIPLILSSEEAFLILWRISFNPGAAVTVIFIRSIPAYGLLLPLSGIGTPAFRTSIEFSDIDAGFSPDIIIVLRVAISTTKKRKEVIIIPVIVASVYLRKFLIINIELIK